MKRLFIFLAVSLFLMTGVKAQNTDPIVERISDDEIGQNVTPAAVAYNFVIACLNKDRDEIMQLATPDLKAYLRINANYNEFMGQFSNPDYEKLNIDSWLPLPAGCEVAVLYQSSEGNGVRKVYINVVPSRELGVSTFQDITRMFDTNVKVIVEKVSGKWLVAGFK